MSVGTYARKVRDPALPFRARVGALRSAVVLYQPLGWHLTLSFLDQAVGGYGRNEQALLRALELLEDSRRHWQAEVDRYARDRRMAKAQGHRSPRPDEPSPFRHPTSWYGPLRPAASLHALAQRRGPLSNSDPLHRQVETLATACLVAGQLSPEDKAALASVAVALRRRARAAAAHGDTRDQFQAMALLRVVEIVEAAATPA